MIRRASEQVYWKNILPSSAITKLTILCITLALEGTRGAVTCLLLLFYHCAELCQSCNCTCVYQNTKRRLSHYFLSLCCKDPGLLYAQENKRYTCFTSCINSLFPIEMSKIQFQITHASAYYGTKR